MGNTTNRPSSLTSRINTASAGNGKPKQAHAQTNNTDVRKNTLQKDGNSVKVKKGQSLPGSAVNKAESLLKSQGDEGGTSVAYSIETAKGAYRVAKAGTAVFKGAQALSVPVQTATVATVKTGINAVKTVDTTLGLVKTGTYSIGQAKTYLMGAFLTSKPVVTIQNEIKTAGRNIVSGVKTAGQNVASGVRTTTKVLSAPYRAVKSVDLTLGMVKTGAISIGQAKVQLLGQFMGTKPVRRLVDSAMAVKTGVVNGVKTAGSVVTAPYRFVKGTYRVVRNIDVQLGMIKTGAIPLNKESLKALAYFVKPYVLAGTNKMAKGTVYVANIAKRGIKVPTVMGGGALTLSNKVGGALLNTDDMGLQALGVGLKTAYYTSRYAPKVVKTTVRGAKTAVKYGVKTGRTAVNTFSFVGRNAKTAYRVASRFGVKKTMGAYGKRIGTSTVNAMKRGAKKGAKAVANAVTEALKGLLQKVAVPLILIILGFMLVVNILSAGASAVAAVLSPFSNDKDTGEEIDETEWLNTKIEEKREKQIEDIEKLYEKKKKPDGDYDIVRFYNGKTDTEVELTETNISDSLYSKEEYLNVIQPIFHVVLLSEYELDASKWQMGNVFDKIWEEIDVIAMNELPKEWCNNGISDNDGNIHASSDCPNHGTELKHGETLDGIMCECDTLMYRCKGHQGSAKCGRAAHTHGYGCYYICGISVHSHGEACLGLVCDGNHSETEGEGGHSYNASTCEAYTCGTAEHSHGGSCCIYAEHTHDAWNSPEDPGCFHTTNHGSLNTHNCGNCDAYKHCGGYMVCDGHKVLKLYVDLQSFDKMLDKYFRDEIADLKNKSNPSDEDKTRLAELEENLGLCLDYIETLEKEFGGTSVGR